MRLKLDENLGRRWSDQIRRAGHDVDTDLDEDLFGASDSSVLDAAVSSDRALITLDLDFSNPVQFPPRRTAGIAVLRVRDRPGRRDLDLAVSELIQGLSAHDLRGRLWVLEPGRIRQYEEDPDLDE